MASHENRFRKLLTEGKQTVSTRLWTTQTLFVEGLGSTGEYDYVEFVAEYASYTLEELRNFCIAAELHDLGTMIKVDYQSRGFLAQKAIASGFQCINFTDCRNAEEVKECIRLTMPETPECKGQFGFPNNRYVGFQPWVNQMYQAKRIKEIVRCFMVEKASSVKEIEEICSVPGVDMVQFGPSDFSLSSGFNAVEHKEEVKEAEKKVIKAALSHGIRPRCEIMSVEDAGYYRDLGVKDFSIGDQMKDLVELWSSRGKGLSNLIGKE